MNIKSVIGKFKKMHQRYPGNSDPLNFKPYLTFGVLTLLTYILTLGRYDPTVLREIIVIIPILGLLLFVIYSPRFEDKQPDNYEKLREMYVYFAFVTLISSVFYIVFILLAQVVQILQISIIVTITKGIAGAPATGIIYYNMYILYDIIREASEAHEEV